MSEKRKIVIYKTINVNIKFKTGLFNTKQMWRVRW